MKHPRSGRQQFAELDDQVVLVTLYFVIVAVIAVQIGKEHVARLFITGQLVFCAIVEDIHTGSQPIVDQVVDGDHVYVPGTEHLWRIDVRAEGMTIAGWKPRYRRSNDAWGLAWDSCLSDGAAWIMDCGDIESVRMIHTTEPNGRYAEPPGKAMSWRRPAPWPGAQRLLRVSLDDPTDVDAIEPFGSPGGGIIAPPVHVPEHDIAIAWDSINGGLAGVSTSGELEVAWQLDNVRPSMQPVVFPESSELVINDFTADNSDDIIVVDLTSGELIDRVPTGSRIANGMFLTAGGNRDVFYCTTTVLARISWS